MRPRNGFSDMDWDKLKVFHAAAEAGSFTHAGEQLGPPGKPGHVRGQAGPPPIIALGAVGAFQRGQIQARGRRHHRRVVHGLHEDGEAVVEDDSGHLRRSRSHEIPFLPRPTRNISVDSLRVALGRSRYTLS